MLAKALQLGECLLTMAARVLVGFVHPAMLFQVLLQRDYFATKVTLVGPLSLS